MDAVVAHIGDVDQDVLGQLLLHAQEVALGVAVLGVCGDVVDVVGAGAEGGGQARGKALATSRW